MPQDPIEPYIEEIARILQTAEANAGRSLAGDVPEDVKEGMKNLEILFKEFKKIADEELEKTENLPKKELTKKEKKIINQCLELGVTAATLGGSLNKARKEAASRMRDTAKNSKKVIQKRKSKFKGIGGRDNWQRT